MNVQVISEIQNHVFTSVAIDKTHDEMYFFRDDGRVFVFYHQQDCCEDVSIEDVAGDLNDLIGTSILVAEVRTSEAMPPRVPEDYSGTWTFYEFRTIKGSVTVRWYGSSNGYYSESVNFKECKAGG